MPTLSVATLDLGKPVLISSMVTLFGSPVLPQIGFPCRLQQLGGVTKRWQFYPTNIAMKLSLQRQLPPSSTHADKCTCALQPTGCPASGGTLRTARDKTINFRSGRTDLHEACVNPAINSFPLTAALIRGSLLPSYSNADAQGTAPPWGEPPSRPRRCANRVDSLDSNFLQQQCDQPCYRRPHLWAPFCLRGQPSAYQA